MTTATAPKEEIASIGHATCEIELEVGAVGADGKAGDDLIWFVASSDYPMERYGMDPAGNWGPWRERLSHGSAAVQLERCKAGKVPLLMEHDTADQIGAIASKYDLVENKKLRLAGDFMSGPREQQIRRDVIEKKRRGASVGYVRKRAKLVEQNDELGPLWDITLWELTELSLVSVPANPMAGAASQGALPPIVVEKEETIPVAGSAAVMTKEELEAKAAADATAAAVVAGEDGARSEIEVSLSKSHAEIFRVATAHGFAHKVPDWIDEGLDEGEIWKRILKAKETRKPAAGATASVSVDLPVEDQRRYSYSRAIAMASGLRGENLGVKFEGLEAEVHRDIEKKLPQGYASQGGIFVPLSLGGQEQEWNNRMSRAALDSKTLAKGSELVFDTPGELIELLRTRTAVIALGARVLSGLSSPVAFPKQTSAITAFWVGENPGADVADSDLGLGLVTLAPKTLQGSTSYSRQLLAQSSIDVESLVRNDISAVHSRAIDRAVIHGFGVAGEPWGLYTVPDVNSAAIGGQPTYIKLIDMEGLVADDNADEGALGWITTPLMAARMKTTPEHATGGMAGWIWTGDFQEGRMGGYRARATNQVSKTMTGTAGAITGGNDHGMIFGNWNDIIIGMFGALELVVDPYAKKKRGLIEVTSFQMIDAIVRHGESFAKATGATTP